MATETEGVVDFTLPSLGSDMEEGTVLAWLVGPGDPVKKGDVLVRVDTEKAEIDVEVWHDATVLELLVEPGATVEVGTPLARLGQGSDEAATAPSPAAAPTEPAAPATAAPTPVVVETPSTDNEPSSSTTHSAPEPVGGTSTRGAPIEEVGVTPRMVYWPSPVAAAPKRSAVEQQETQDGAAVEPVEELSRADRRQSAVASLMERSNREIPHFHLARTIDLTDTLAWLDERNQAVSPPERILPAALLLYGVAQAAAGSVVNGTFDGGPVDAEHVDLGVAVHVRGGGLMTPVLPHADSMAVDTLMSELQEAVGRARAGRLNTRDMTPATLTVTNLGDSGVDVVYGVIRPPERALVGFGRIGEGLVVVDGEPVIRSTVQVALSADHRVINGQAGARFLAALDRALTDPTMFNLAGDAS